MEAMLENSENKLVGDPGYLCWPVHFGGDETMWLTVTVEGPNKIQPERMFFKKEQCLAYINNRAKN